MAPSNTIYAGMEVHKDALAGASVAQAHGAEVSSLGALGTRQGDLEQLGRKMPSTAKRLLVVSEAGPCGDGLSRSLTKQGDDCWVVAPSLPPQKAGDRVTTDRRDAVPRARRARSGALTAVEVPPVDDAASRALSRARAEALSDLNDAKFRLTALLLRQNLRSAGRAKWGPAPLRWLSAVACPTPAQPIVLQEEVYAVKEHTARLQRLEQARQARVTSWRLDPVVGALQALRGVHGTAAVIRVAAPGDLTRVESPRELMEVLGLIAAAYPRAARRRQGAMTNAGTTHARSAPVEGAWAYRYPARIGRHRQRRLGKHPQVLQDIRWNAQIRRCQRSRRLGSRGQHAHIATVAMARARVGFRWAVAQQAPVTA